MVGAWYELDYEAHLGEGLLKSHHVDKSGHDRYNFKQAILANRVVPRV